MGVLRPFQAKHSGLGSTPSRWAGLGPCPSPSHLGRASGYSPQAVASRRVAGKWPPGCSFQQEARLPEGRALPHAVHTSMCSRGSALDPVCIQSPLGQCHPIARMEKWGLAGPLPLQAAVWG